MYPEALRRAGYCHQSNTGILYVVQGRIKRRQWTALAQERLAITPEISVCALCDRPILPALRDAHHLVPKSRGGVSTVYLHRACHRQIHALFTENELAKSYSTVIALCAHPEMAKFINWVKGKTSEFNPPTKRSRNKGRF
jgi:hypothetical protein